MGVAADDERRQKHSLESDNFADDGGVERNVVDAHDSHAKSVPRAEGYGHAIGR